MTRKLVSFLLGTSLLFFAACAPLTAPTQEDTSSLVVAPPTSSSNANPKIAPPPPTSAVSLPSSLPETVTPATPETQPVTAAVQSDNEYFERVIETGHFRTYFHPQDGEFAAGMVRIEESLYPLLFKTYGGEPPIKTDIYLFLDLEEARKLGFCLGAPVQPDPDSTAGEFTLSEPLGEGVKLYVPPERKVWSPAMESFMQFLLAHEVGHRFFFYTCPDIRSPIRPNWLDEGLAMYIGIEASKQLHHFEPILQSVKGGQPPLADLDDLDRLQESGNNPGLFYGEAATVIYYILLTYQEDTLGQFLTGYNQGLNLDRAFEEVLDLSYGDFAEQWISHIRKIAVQSDDINEFYSLLTGRA